MASLFCAFFWLEVAPAFRGLQQAAAECQTEECFNYLMYYPINGLGYEAWKLLLCP